MSTINRWMRSKSFHCAVWIGLTFALTSSIYLSWVYHLTIQSTGVLTEWISLVYGYLLQAAGIGISMILVKKKALVIFRQSFISAVLLLTVASATALCSEALLLTVVFGLLMNLFCGILSGMYLLFLSIKTQDCCFGRVFSGGYASAVMAVWLFSLVCSGALIHSRYALLCYLPLTILLLLFTQKKVFWDTPDDLPAAESCPNSNSAEKKADRKLLPLSWQDLLLAGLAVFLASIVKNLGFSFPSADIRSSLIPELSRLFYAAGLCAAGVLYDRNRKYGMVCTIGALMIPFLMLSLSKEAVSGGIIWGLDYLFYGFFTVFRVVLFLDLASYSGGWILAPLGLLLGRIGDAAGTAVNLLLSGHSVLLIACTTLLFFPAVILLFVMEQRLYAPENPGRKSDQELFDSFCMKNDFSNREKQVFRLLITQHTNGEIAETLFITENTVKYHVRNILQKTGCKNRIELQNRYTVYLSSI